MICVGIDVHKTTSTLVAVDPSTGEYAQEKVFTKEQDMLAVLKKVPEPLVVGVEATLLSPAVTTWLVAAGYDVRLLDPQALADCVSRRRAKTDRTDALLMARALLEGWDVECYLAGDDVRQLRALTRGREPLVKTATMYRNQLRSLLMRCGIEVQATDLCGAAGSELMEELIDNKLQNNEAIMAAQYWNQLLEAKQRLDTTDRLIAQEVKAHPVASVLEPWPGCGPITALTTVAEIGRIDRFPSHRHLHSYGGVIPTTHQSGDSTQPGHVPRECNKRLRNAAITVAQAASRSSAPNKMKTAYEQVGTRCGPNTGKMAAARKFLTDVWFTWWQVVGG